MTFIEIPIYSASEELADQYDQAKNLGIEEPEIKTSDLEVKNMTINTSQICYLYESGNGTLLYFVDFEFMTPWKKDKLLNEIRNAL